MALVAWASAAIGRRGLALGALALTGTVTAVALAVRIPPPATLDQLRANPQLALLCPLAQPPPTTT